jgi:hypothetical protein
VLAVVLGSAVAAWCLAGAADALALPDLTVKRVEFVPSKYAATNPPNHAYITRQGVTQFTVRTKTENDGASGADASETEVRMDDLPVGSASVAPLPTGEHDQGATKVATELLSPGFYKLSACADPDDLIAESDETNNCKQGVLVTIIPALWKAKLMTHTRTSSVPSTETAKAQKITFRYSPTYTQQEGDFQYTVEGSIFGSISGSDGPCSVSGSGTADSGTGFWPRYQSFLWLSPDLRTYYASVADGSKFYMETHTCPGGNYQGPQPFLALQTFVQPAPPPAPNTPTMKPEDTILRGASAFVDGGADEEYDWKLVADIPAPPPPP